MKAKSQKQMLLQTELHIQKEWILQLQINFKYGNYIYFIDYREEKTQETNALNNSKFEDQYALNAEISNKIKDLENLNSKLNLMFEGFQNDFKVLSKKFFETKVEVYDKIIDVQSKLFIQRKLFYLFINYYS